MTSAPAVPRHADGVLLEQEQDRSRLVATRAHAALALDPTALALWELCDGETTVEEMTLAVCALFDAAEATVQHDIAEVLDTLVAAGFLEWVTPPRPDGRTAR